MANEMRALTEGEKQAIARVRPNDRDELRGWVKTVCGLRLPGKGVCVGHGTPLDYLEHVFLEKGGDVVVWSCRGGGKTMMGAVATLLDLVFKAGVQVRIVAGSREQAGRMFGYLRSFVEGPFAALLAKPVRGGKIVMKNGARAEVLAQAETSVRGQRVQKVRCDEVELFTREVWEAVQLTTRSEAHAMGTVEGLSTMHVAGGLMEELMGQKGRKVFKWCVWDVMERCPAERECGGCPLLEECGGRAKGRGSADGFVLVEDVVAMKGRVGKAVWEAEMLCQRPRAESRAFGMFEREKQVREWRGKGEERGWKFVGWTAGVDFGYRAPFVWLWIAVMEDERGRTALWVADEYVQEKVTLAGHMREVEARVAGSEGRLGKATVVWCDPAGRTVCPQTGRTDEAVMREAGYRVRSMKQRVLDGVHVIRELLEPAEGGPRLLVDPRCERLIRSMEWYRQGRDGAVEKDGEHDHAIDALRYAVMPLMRRQEGEEAMGNW